MAERNFTDEQEAEIAKEYLAGKSAREIARSRGLKYHISIISALRRQGVTQRSPAERNRLYSLNPNIFDIIDTEHKAYFWGLLYADGGVYKRSLSLKVKKSDERLCYRLKEFLESEHHITDLSMSDGNNYHGQVMLFVTDKHLTQRLKQLGIKTGRPNPQETIDQIPDNLFHHWLRGLYDGDGSARKSPSIVFCGGYELLTILKHKIADYCSTNPDLTVTPHNKANLWYLYFSGRLQALKVSDFMYKDASIYLERKREVVDSWPKPQKRYRNKKGQFIQTAP